MDYDRYLRQDKMPLIWCPGCGHGIILKAMLRAIDKLGLDKNEVVMVSGIGCSSRATGYVDVNTLHTTHGRPLAFATGIKLTRPDLTVMVVTGDGDATAIGGNHFIHAARRNIDVTVVLYNNWIYGMTGGQASPTTPIGARATTAPFGVTENTFDISGLAAAAGASYVARGSVTEPVKLDRYIRQGLQKKGFALIEAFTPCPTSFGRQNKQGTGAAMMAWLKEHTIDARRAAKLPPEELADKLITGVLVDVDKPEFCAGYSRTIELARERVRLPALPEREVIPADPAERGAVR